MKTPWLLVVVLALAIGGCADEVPEAGASVKSADQGSSRTATTPASTPPQTPVETPLRNVIRNGSMTVRVPDVEKSERQLTRDLASAGGYVAGSHSAGYGTGSPTVELNLKIPAARLDGVIETISAYGVVLDKQLSSEDVTDQLIDAEARLKTLASQESRYRELLGKANNINQIAEIESKLGDVRTQIERISATRKSMADRAAMSELKVTLTQDAATLPATQGQAGWLNESWGQATGAFLGVLQMGGTVAVWLLVFSPLWGAVAGGTWLVARQSKAKR